MKLNQKEGIKGKMKWFAVSEAARGQRQSFDERFDMINADQQSLITVTLSSSSSSITIFLFLLDSLLNVCRAGFLSLVMHEVLMRHSLPFACRRVRGYKQGFVSDHFQSPVMKTDAIIFCKLGVCIYTISMLWVDRHIEQRYTLKRI